MGKIDTISILGCGWIGYALAIELIKRGVNVKGSTTNPGKIKLFRNAGIRPYQFTIENGEISGIEDISGFFLADLLIITLPPKARKKGPDHGIGQIEKIREVAGDFAGKVIYTSSTSVYPPDGNNHNEESVPKNQLLNAHPILRIEKILKTTFRNNLTILRFGGLFGYDRIPVKYFLGKKELDNAKFPVNYLHRDDAVKSIMTIIEKQAWGKIYNVVSPLHPTREEVFLKNAEILNVESPTFSERNTKGFKTINGDKMVEELGFIYQFPDPLKFSYNPDYKPL